MDDCLCPEMKQRYENGELTGRFIKKNETIFVVADRPVEAAEGGEISAVCEEQGVYALRQTGDALVYRIRLKKGTDDEII